MKMKDLRELNEKELDSKLHQLQEELFNLRMKKKITEITNNMQFRNIRKDIARIKTIENERKRTQEK